uniref:Polycomb group ring finger 1 n=1 Tax=Chelonoidis abingdonii TaxID=106734 RepID=A0A8C0G3X7_CHEAB
MCNTKIHETQPLLNLKLDRVMQDVVYKLVPGLQESEWEGGSKYVRCSVRAQVRHLRRVLCHRLGLALQHVQILYGSEVLPDHMTMKQLWLSRWFGRPAPLLLHYSVKEKRR